MIFKDKKIIICSPGNVLISGGVNSLHNLCRALQHCGFNAFMYYIDADENIVNHEYYKAYNVNRLKSIEDDANHLIITPETLTPFLLQFKHAKKMVYWLGLTLFYKTPTWRFPFTIKPFRKLIECRSYFGYSSGTIENVKRQLYDYAKSHLTLWDGEVLHLSNSNLVGDYCRSKGVNAHVLHNPIRDEFYNNAYSKKRKDIILFGPKTPNKYIRKVKRQLPNYETKKLKRLPAQDVFNYFSQAKVFIEFGNFSGRDRMPREAAMLGCVVITNTRGTASSQEDYNLDKIYKIADIKINNKRIINTIVDCALAYNKHYELQHSFREQLSQEHKDFETRVENVFKDILTNCL